MYNYYRGVTIVKRRIIDSVRWVLCSLAVLSSLSTAQAGEFVNGLTLQGYTGIMNTPTANVQKEGTFAFWYAKQRDHLYPYAHEDNYLFSVGLFSLLEAGGRVAIGLSPSPGNDISAQFKLTTAPFTPKKYPWLPTLAFGMQDVGGKASFFNSTYLVATEEISRLRLSLGYGFGSDRRLEGVFAGAEVKAFDWLYLLGEYGAKDTSAFYRNATPDFNIGARVVTPDIFGYPVNFHSTIKSAVNKNPGTIDFTVGVQFALGKDWHGPVKSIIPTAIPDDTGTRPLSDLIPFPVPAPPLPSAGSGGAAEQGQPSGTPAPVTGEEQGPLKADTGIVAAATPVDVPSVIHGGSPDSPLKAGQEVTASTAVATADEALRTLRDRLVANGFMHVKVGARGKDLLVVEYENARYNQNQLDAMGVVLGMVTACAPDDYRTVRLVLKVQNLRMLQVTVPTASLRSFLNDALFEASFRDLVAVSYGSDDDQGVNYLAEGSFATWFRSRLTLTPWLTTYVATELRGLDYLLSFAPSLSIDLWKGSYLNAVANIPVAWSKGYDDREPFRRFRNDPRLESLMLFQALRPHPNLMMSFSGGMISNEVYGTINEAYLYSNDGSHRLGFQQGYGRDTRQDFDRTSYLGSYRYSYAPLDTSLTVTGGSFWQNDTGVRADLTRFFGDTSFSLFYKICRTAKDVDYQMGGVEIAFPLTPRQGMKPYPVQIKGTDDWRYGIQTVTDSPDGSNSVFVSIGELPPIKPVTQTYYDRDRLTPEYIKNHLLRIRDAYLRYVKPD